MKKNLLTLAMLAVVVPISAQVLTHVDDTGLFYVGQGALVYSGGGVQTKASGILDVHGNVMIDGTATAGSVLKTIDSGGGAKTSGGNIILRLNDTTNYDASTYGQLFITGLTQGNITGIVDKEFKTKKHGTYQQIALPFSGKALSSLSAELGKTFVSTRWSQSEILAWNNNAVRSDHFTNLSTVTDATSRLNYYMLGSKNLDTSANLYTIKGRPIADDATLPLTYTLSGAGNGLNFGSGGNALNIYNEKYNTYLQDQLEASSSLWTGTYGKNIYQFGNPFFTNLDLSKIGYVEGATTTDGNAIAKIWAVRYDPGSVLTHSSGSTYSSSASNALYTTYTSGVPTGDVGLLVKPMGTFVIKLLDASTSPVLDFKTLRRFNYTTRNASTNYSVTAAKVKPTSSVKQLGVVAIDSNGRDIGRTYYVVYKDGTTGHSTAKNTQIINTNTNLIGTFEENPIHGGYDTHFTSSYWLYINEANETTFQGKAIPMVLYSTAIKSLRFEIRENAEFISNGQSILSSGLEFYYKVANGTMKAIHQGEVIPVTGTEYSLYYGAVPNSNFTTGTKSEVENTITKPSRTMVAFNPNIDNYIVQFDPLWKSAEVKVYDTSGKLVISKDKIDTSSDFVIELSKQNKTAYIVSITSDKGEKVNAKIVR